MLVKNVDLPRRMDSCSTANESNRQHLVINYGSYLTIYILLQCKDNVFLWYGTTTIGDRRYMRNGANGKTERLRFVSCDFL